MGALGTWLVSLAGPIIRRMMLALGFGVVSYAAVSTALTAALGAAKAAFAGMGSDTLAFVAMAGFPTALSVIAGALVARVALQAVKKLELVK